MKLLLYCTKGKPYLLREDLSEDLVFFGINKDDVTGNILNGKIVAECDYEVEEIYYGYEIDDFWTKTCGSQKDIKHNLLKQSCFEHEEMYEYLQPKDSYYGECGKAIHIKNLNIFDVPKDFSEYSKKVEHHKCDECLEECRKHCKYYYAKNNITQTINTGCTQYAIFYKAPQNMMYVFDGEEKKVLISIHPEWLCKILNGEKTIEIRKKVLKEMIR